MRVTVVVALPQAQEVAELDLAQGATVRDALEAARVHERYPDLRLDDAGIWGKRCAPATRLREGDRVEVYRPVLADAKALRRARAGVKPSSRSRSGP